MLVPLLMQANYNCNTVMSRCIDGGLQSCVRKDPSVRIIVELLYNYLSQAVFHFLVVVELAVNICVEQQGYHKMFLHSVISALTLSNSFRRRDFSDEHNLEDFVMSSLYHFLFHYNFERERWGERPKCITNVYRIFRKSVENEKRKSAFVCDPIDYCYANIRSWFIEIPHYTTADEEAVLTNCK